MKGLSDLTSPAEDHVLYETLKGSWEGKPRGSRQTQIQPHINRFVHCGAAIPHQNREGIDNSPKMLLSVGHLQLRDGESAFSAAAAAP
jgi:hypothetical protein